MKVQGPEQLVGLTVVDATGRRIGVVRRVLCPEHDPYTAQWALVSLGPWWARRRLVPLREARDHERGIQIALPRTVVAASPRIGSRADDVTHHAARSFYRNHPW